MTAFLSSVLALSAVLLVAVQAPTLGVEALAGASQTAVSAALGVAPVDNGPGLEGIPTTRVYAMSDGTLVSVLYCADQATTFDIRFGTAVSGPTEAAAWVGVPTTGAVVSESSVEHVHWIRPEDGTTGVQLREMVASRSEVGWDRVIVRYTVPC